jgi:hypothetical protein
LLFNVWDRIEENEFADVVTRALESVFPADPPRFMARTPHGYHDIAAMTRHVAEGGFTATPELRRSRSEARRCRRAFRRLPIARGRRCATKSSRGILRDWGKATDAAAEAIAARFGRGAVDGKIQAHVVTVAR